MKDSHRRDSGQSLLEFALVLPVLLLILMGIIDFGLVFNRWLVIEHAARDAVRSVSLGLTTDQAGVQTIVSNEAGSGAVASLTGTVASQSPVTVDVTDHVTIIDPLMVTILGSSYKVESSVTMLVE